MWADRIRGDDGHLPQSFFKKLFLGSSSNNLFDTRRFAAALLALLLLCAASQVAADPIVSQKVTLSEARLATACVKSGETKENCICVARTLRNQLPAYDYAPSLLLQTAHYNDTSTNSARIALTRQGVTAHDIQALDRQRRRIVMNANLADCSLGLETTTS